MMLAERCFRTRTLWASHEPMSKSVISPREIWILCKDLNTSSIRNPRYCMHLEMVAEIENETNS